MDNKNKGALSVIRRINREIASIRSLLEDGKLGSGKDVDALILSVDRTRMCANNVAARLGDKYEDLS